VKVLLYKKNNNKCTSHLGWISVDEKEKKKKKEIENNKYDM